MTGLDGVAAARYLLNLGTVLPGLCLRYVWESYKSVGATSDTTYGTALAAWEASAGKHPDDWNPPAGVPVWWGAKPGSAAGDVVISLGEGMVAATDYPRYGVTGVASIAARTAQINRPYLGWTEQFIGNVIDYGEVPQPPAPPTNESDSDMEFIILNGNPDSGIQIQPGIPPYSLPDQVFRTLCSVYGKVPHVIADRSQYETAVGAQWTAYDVAQQYANTSVNRDSVDEIARESARRVGLDYDVTPGHSA